MDRDDVRAARLRRLYELGATLTGDPQEVGEALVAMADAALLQGKARGKNQVCDCAGLQETAAKEAAG